MARTLKYKGVGYGLVTVYALLYVAYKLTCTVSQYCVYYDVTALYTDVVIPV
jgi:hypothetical protein